MFHGFLKPKISGKKYYQNNKSDRSESKISQTRRKDLSNNNINFKPLANTKTPN